MQKARCWVKPYAFQRGCHIVGYEGVKERQKRIHLVQRRSSRTSVKEEVVLGFRDQVIEHVKVCARRIAFIAAHCIQRATAANVFANAVQTKCGTFQLLRLLIVLGKFPRGAQQDGPAIGDLRQDDAAAILADFASLPDHRYCSRRSRMLPETGPWKCERNTSLGAQTHQWRTRRNPAKADYARKGVDRRLQKRLVFETNQNRLALARKIRSLRRHIKRIQQLLHSVSKAPSR